MVECGDTLITIHLPWVEILYYSKNNQFLTRRIINILLFEHADQRLIHQIIDSLNAFHALKTYVSYESISP